MRIRNEIINGDKTIKELKKIKNNLNQIYMKQQEEMQDINQ